jgi:hypothetical protein
MILKIYVPISSSAPENKYYLNEFLGDMRDNYNNFFLIVNEPKEADIFMMPLKWNYYFEKNRINAVIEECLRANTLNKPIVIFSDGDYTANSRIHGLIVFEKSSYRSRRKEYNMIIFAIPVFISDYVKLYCNGNIQLRNKKDKPVIGFCGQGGGNVLDFTKRRIINLYRKLSFHAGIRRWEPAPFETTIFRFRILKAISENSKIHSNFIIRNRYRAGYLPKKKDLFHPTRTEFVKNILDSDYTLCMRGAGNFSVRFYETLSLGRIPVFIDTDCLLPFDDLINYQKYCLWVKQEEIPFVTELILDFHSSINASEFMDLQNECRNLWCERLSKEGFFRHFYEHF